MMHTTKSALHYHLSFWNDSPTTKKSCKRFATRTERTTVRDDLKDWQKEYEDVASAEPIAFEEAGPETDRVQPWDYDPYDEVDQWGVPTYDPDWEWADFARKILGE